jgi:hypothetical protein
LRRGDGSRNDARFPRFKERVALVAAQMISYHERFRCDAKTLGVFHALVTTVNFGNNDSRGEPHRKQAASLLCPEYKRKVLREYVRAVAEIGAARGGKSDGDGDGDGDVSDDDDGDSDAMEDAMDNALDAMLEAQMAGRIDEFDDDFDAIAAEEAADRRKKKKRRR